MSDTSAPDKVKLPKVDLGTNSLLIIAFIVTVCSGSEQRSNSETREKIQELQQSVARLEAKIDVLTTAAPAAAAPTTKP